MPVLLAEPPRHEIQQLVGMHVKVLIPVKPHSGAERIRMLRANPDDLILGRCSVDNLLNVVLSRFRIEGILVLLNLGEEDRHRDARNCFQGIRKAEPILLALGFEDEPPPLNWSAPMFRKWRTKNGKQATEAGRDSFEVTAS